MKGFRYFMGCLLVWLVACQQHEVVEPLEEPVELTFKLDLGNDASRALEDGDYLDLVSVYIVDGNKNIVASQENITVANNATEVEVTFGKSYNLKRGLHTLMAVANHGTLTFEENSYASLISNQVHPTNGTDNISPKNTVQPLSLMKEIELHAGNNQIEGELVRTFARLGITLKNNSGSFPLKINSLTFSDNFTQQQAYVFDDGTDRKYSFGTDAPKSNSSHAKTPFTAMELEAQESAVLFDAYLLESKAAEGEKYTYTLNLAYEDVEVSQVSYSQTGGAISQVNNLDGFYLIQNSNSGRYLSAGDNIVETSTLSELNDLGTHVVWRFTRSGTNSYKIMNVETGQYIQELLRNSSNVALGSSELSYTLSVSGSTILFSNSSRYMMVNNGNVGSTTTRNDTKRNFKIYKVIENRIDNEKQDRKFKMHLR